MRNLSRQYLFIYYCNLNCFAAFVLAKITWYGHAALKIEVAGKTLFIDPMLQNPNSPLKLSEVTQADLVYVTHDHPDHLGDAFEICKRTGAIFAAVYEIAEEGAKNGVKKCR